jgi:hypothetical protein
LYVSLIYLLSGGPTNLWVQLNKTDQSILGEGEYSQEKPSRYISGESRRSQETRRSKSKSKLTHEITPL